MVYAIIYTNEYSNIEQVDFIEDSREEAARELADEWGDYLYRDSPLRDIALYHFENLSPGDSIYIHLKGGVIRSVETEEEFKKDTDISDDENVIEYIFNDYEEELTYPLV